MYCIDECTLCVLLTSVDGLLSSVSGRLRCPLGTMYSLHHSTLRNRHRTYHIVTTTTEYGKATREAAFFLGVNPVIHYLQRATTP
jgi:hypothetical protein